MDGVILKEKFADTAVPVPVGIIIGIEVEVGLALHVDVTIKISKQSRFEQYSETLLTFYNS